MAAYLVNGRLIDGIIALLAFEALALAAVRAFLGRGPSVVSSIANCTAGGALFLALRSAMADAPFAVIGGCLLVALAAHVVDLATRWRGSSRAVGILRSHSPTASAAMAPENSRV
jgi:hypothetical protein